MARTALFLNPGADLSPALALARRADTLGYESLWVTHGIGRDALQMLAAYGQVASHAGLGSGVIPIYPRHPVLLAQEALTLSDVSGGRLRLGIGVSHKPVMEGALGLDMGQPLEVTREYVTVLRAALTGKVDHRGARYRVSWQSGLPRLPAPPPILLGGLAPRMLEQSGFGAEIAVYDRAPRPESVPDRLVAALGGIGDFRAVSAFVTAYREAGVTLPALRPIGFPDAQHFEPTVKAGVTA